MKCLDLTLSSPAENLACDEALLDLCEGGFSHEILRFWDPAQYFVVVGYANKVASEVNVSACEARGIPILRRCTGGGTVLQGPGCLNYSLVLRIDQAGPFAGVAETNRFVMHAHRKALQRLILERIDVCGHTDLAIDSVKFLGNAQRRRRKFLLFHGSFLLNFDLGLMEQLLPIPSHQPDYRKGRTHREFLRNLNLPSDAVKRTLRTAWGPAESLGQIPSEAITRLVMEKYSRPEWNLKF